MNKRPYALMVKPVGAACNLACSYCYYLNNPVSRRQPMSDEHLEKLIASYLGSTHNEIFSFVWHGGEPALASLAFYQKAVELQKKYLPSGAQCWNNLQTNALLLDEKWCEFLRKENFDVGVSIDGIRLVHDTYRLDTAGKRTYDRVAEKISLLKSYGIRPDLLCTVSADTAEHAYEVYQALKNFRTGWIQFIPIVNKNPDGSIRKESVSPETYGTFLKVAFNQWLYNDLGTCNVQLFMEMLNVYLGGRQSLCWLKEECGDVLAVESDGNVYSCDHYVNNDHHLGNIAERNLDQLFESEKQQLFARKKSDLNEECRTCPYLFLCNGGCSKDRDESGHNYLCAGLKTLFIEADQPLKKAAELLKKGEKPQTVMSILKQDRRIRYKDLSGNSPCPCGSGRRYKHCCLN